LPSASLRCLVIWRAGVAPSSWSEDEILLDPDGTAHSRYGLTELGWYLIRPDQYIAARGLQSELSLLRDYLQKIY
jgi:hypothetical protein